MYQLVQTDWAEPTLWILSRVVDYVLDGRVSYIKYSISLVLATLLV